jgi:8-oxo-dGTP pyrophosphatase MutT (NUDIX family)
LKLTPAQRARLGRLLDSHSPADEREGAHLAHVRAFVLRHDDPFDRSIAEGHLTGSAFVLDPSGRVLLTHHLHLGIWVQLGGHSDGEGAAEDVTMREAREESGLADLAFHPALLFADGSPRLLDVDVHRIPARRDEPAHEHLDLRFLLETRTPALIVANPSETKALEWVSLVEARRRGDAGMYRALSRLFALRGQAPPVPGTAGSPT